VGGFFIYLHLIKADLFDEQYPEFLVIIAHIDQVRYTGRPVTWKTNTKWKEYQAQVLDDMDLEEREVNHQSHAIQMSIFRQ